MRKISRIEPKLPIIPVRKKVAAYARVSRDTERLMHSVSAQVSYYSTLIQKNPEWEYAGVYADMGISGMGISGTGISGRSEFLKMLADCEAGKIDIILTKSISRFARNTVDLLETVRHLKSLGIEVRFEKEHINSLSEDGELMLSLLASFAQEESRSISENCKWGIRKRFQSGEIGAANKVDVQYDNIFSGLVKCADCGFALTYVRAHRNWNSENILANYDYQCNNYRMEGKTACTQHRITALNLYNAVLADIKRLANEALGDDRQMISSIAERLGKAEKDTVRQAERELKRANKRLSELNRLFAKLYEEHINGKVSERNYNSLSAAYETEQTELESRISELNSVINEERENGENAENFVDLIKQYADIDELTQALLNILIDRIEVHEPEDVDGEFIQKLDVYYKFVGRLD